MVLMDGVREHSTRSAAENESVSGREELTSERQDDSDEASDFIIIDENSIYGRRRHSIEERNERQRLGKDDDTESTSDRAGITLYPFAHQVGGHTQLLALDKGTLCKPLVPRELLFYLNVPKQLASFVPAYKGVVQIGETSAGNYQPLVHQPLRSRKSSLFGALRCSSAKKNSPTASAAGQQQLARNKSTECDDWSPLEMHVQLRPFSDEKMLKKNLSQDNLLRADYISRPNEKYLLLLENVAAKYKLPCILDLKMGTRQHGDDASEEKRHRQIAKCQASTSASLGVRLCGMQVYKVDYGGYLWYDKYCGRKMDERGLKRALREYFRADSHASEQSTQIIDDIIKRLELLHSAVENSPAFRFYGTSLLIVHESCQLSKQEGAQQQPAVDVRLIDFAHTICDLQATGGRASSSPSILRAECSDVLVGARRPDDSNKCSAGERFPNFDSQACQVDERENRRPTGAGGGAAASEQQADANANCEQQATASAPHGTSAVKPPLAGAGIKRAQAVGALTQLAAGRKTSRHSMGPDKGLLFGLENLMRLLDDLKSEETSSNDNDDPLHRTVMAER